MRRNEPLHRVTHDDGVPTRMALEDGAPLFAVRVLSRWRTTGEYWNGDIEKRYFRVERMDRIGGEFVIYVESAGNWYLDRSLD
ncbi:MAG: hypothetical protein O3A46_09675 [Candidatus Poribacteria bacterium]|nr:hypothetical protein [Candidatus Poribacteria bacterium]